MTYTFKISTGEFSQDDVVLTTAYSGFGDGVDNTNEEAIPDQGPIPEGTYTIGAAFTHPQCGPIAMRLTPSDDTNTFGRAGFLIHGDNAAMNHTASHGCIIVNKTVRLAIDAGSDKTLQVIA